jgi:Fe-S-cluster-containing dehydrogenase component/CRP-like cAMP-binding protein
MVPREPGEPWPAVVFDAPVLRGLDARARREIAEAGRLLDVARAGAVYRAGDEGASFFVVAAGRVAVRAIRRGDQEESDLRAATAGGSFGEEATVGLARRGSAVALEASRVAEIPVHVFQRAVGRAGTAALAERLQRSLHRTATSDLLETLAFTRELGQGDRDVLLDAIAHRRVERGDPVFRQGDPVGELFLVADGMVQIQTEDEGRLHVRAYLARGDFFGDAEILEGARTRRTSAVASGPSLLLAVPAAVFRDLAARNAGLAPSLRRVAEDQAEAQRALVAPAAANATQHVFRDVYRLQVARSLLVIDLEACVRCGHCAWACSELYGVARLVRRGDKIVTRLEVGAAEDDPLPKHLMLPNSCQHCENPACMVGCPTGAIGRDPAGEVYVRDALCTGCGACAKACPWDNIQIAARPLDAPRPAFGDFAEVAVKCDLCRGYDGPACAKACPTDAIFRVSPADEIVEVRALFGAKAQAVPGAAAERGTPFLLSGATLAAAGIAVAGSLLQARGVWAPSRGLGLGAGVLAAAGMVALLGYAWRKRRVRSWMRARATEATRDAKAPSVVRPALDAHLAIGVVTLGLALAHARPLGAAGHGAAVMVALLATSVAGAFTAAAYRVVPARLARIERTAALPEDLPRVRAELRDRLYRDASGKSDLVKRLLERVLLPYARAPLGPLALLASGRTLRAEEAALLARIDVLLEGRGRERLAGLAELARTVVELRALPAQRMGLACLRLGLPIHVVTFTIALALLALHVAGAIVARR